MNSFSVRTFLEEEQFQVSTFYKIVKIRMVEAATLIPFFFLICIVHILFKTFVFDSTVWKINKHIDVKNLVWNTLNKSFNTTCSQFIVWLIRLTSCKVRIAESTGENNKSTRRLRNYKCKRTVGNKLFWFFFHF